jgi:cytochrome c oxidase assembly protein subunit 15
MHRFAVLTAAAAWLLGLLGAQVTSLRAGMVDPQAVRSPWYFFSVLADAGKQPDPQVFLRSNVLYLIEHGHRQAGWIVGLMTMVLAAWSWRPGVDSSVRWLAGLALVGVGIQGILGILRVAENSLAWAMVHGVSGQAVIALLFALALVCSSGWRAATQAETGDAGKWRRLTMMTVLLLVAQLIVGVWLRQQGIGLYVHMVLALGVAAHVFLLLGRVNASVGAAADWLRVPVRSMALLLVVQLVLGVWVWQMGGGGGAYDHRQIPLARALAATAHVGIGALMLAASLLAAMRSFRHLRPRPRPALTLEPRGGTA